MPTFVAFLRAVNVAPRWVPMADLREALESAGFTDVATHIQTGNVRVTTPLRSPARVEAAIEAVVRQGWGFHADAMVRTPARVAEIVTVAEAAPRAEGETRRYVSLAKAPVGEVPPLAAWAEPGETVLLDGGEVHWGIARTMHESRLSNARIERFLGGPSTARDLKVLRAVVAKWCQR